MSEEKKKVRSGASRRKTAVAKAKIAEKWGENVVKRGFSQIPFYLLHINKFLDQKLSSLQLLILIQLVSNWWEKETNPFPSMSNIAERCGVSERQIQRSIDDLVKRKIIEKVKISTDRGVVKRNTYNMSGLVDLLSQAASSNQKI